MGGVAARLWRLEKRTGGAGGAGRLCPECKGLGPQNRVAFHFDYEPAPPPPTCETCGRVGEFLLHKITVLGPDFDRRAFAPKEDPATVPMPTPEEQPP